MEKRVTIQGVAGCYHDAAARAYFNDEEISVKLNYKESKKRKIGLSLPDAGCASVAQMDENNLALTIRPRSLVLILSE